MSLLATVLLASAGAAPAPVADEELLNFWIADLETFFADPKDQRLLQALKLIDDRVLELPDEIPGFEIPVPPEVIQLALHLCSGEKSLRILSSDDPNLMFPVYGQLELMEGSPERAQEIARMLLGLAQGAGAPVGEPLENGMVPVEGAPVPIVFGARGSEVILSAGKVIERPINLSNTGLPTGVAPSMLLDMNIGAVLRMVQPMAAQSSEGAMLFDILEKAGLTDLELNVASGSDRARSYSVTTVPRFAGHMRSAGMLPARALGPRDLQLVPKDAVLASVGTMNFGGTFDFVLSIAEPFLADMGIDDPVQMVADMTGFHIKADLIDHLGSTYGIYTSDTTGGGGLLSAVMFIELANSDGLLDTTERMQDILNGLADAEADGYVELRSWDQGGTTYLTLTFPGLPVPLEPTVAFTNHHMIAALTPSNCVAAVGQAKGEGPSLLDHPGFRENLPGPIEGAYGVSFFDTPRMIKDGYGLTNLLCSALVNGTRSRTDETRDVGIIMPSYHELMRGAKAQVGITRIEGNDFVSRNQGDRSVLVNMTSTVGFIAGSPLLLAIPAALMFTAASRSESVYYDAKATDDWEDKDDY